MNKTGRIFIICVIFTLQSCLFGVGLVEEKISNNIYLSALNTYDELSIWYSTDDSSIRSLLVPETVFAVGYNSDFVIAKSHPKNVNNQINKELTYYHIIEIDKVSESKPEQSISMLKKQYEFKRKELQVSKKLDFETIFMQNE